MNPDLFDQLLRVSKKLPGESDYLSALWLAAGVAGALTVGLIVTVVTLLWVVP